MLPSSCLEEEIPGVDHDIDPIIFMIMTCNCMHWNEATYWNSCGKGCIHVWLSQPSNHRELHLYAPSCISHGSALQSNWNAMNWTRSANRINISSRRGNLAVNGACVTYQISYTLMHTYWRSWVLLEEPLIGQALKNFPAFNGTQRFNTVWPV
jgi:hypothetical protein